MQRFQGRFLVPRRFHSIQLTIFLYWLPFRAELKRYLSYPAYQAGTCRQYAQAETSRSWLHGYQHSGIPACLGAKTHLILERRRRRELLPIAIAPQKPDARQVPLPPAKPHRRYSNDVLRTPPADLLAVCSNRLDPLTVCLC